VDQLENVVCPEHLVFLVLTVGLAFLALRVLRVFKEKTVAYVLRVKINYNL